MINTELTDSRVTFSRQVSSREFPRRAWFTRYPGVHFGESQWIGRSSGNYCRFRATWWPRMRFRVLFFTPGRDFDWPSVESAFPDGRLNHKRDRLSPDRGPSRFGTVNWSRLRDKMLIMRRLIATTHQSRQEHYFHRPPRFYRRASIFFCSGESERWYISLFGNDDDHE